MAYLPKFLEVKDAIQKGLESLNKYHGKVNDTDAYFICLCKSTNINNLQLSVLINIPSS